jgi:UDP-N-acetylglucosamine--N-acetylmuramyl-(pentapeptide) pyrophosphoryl-undecaprenol N-acetylglucosamine transferase
VIGGSLGAKTVNESIEAGLKMIIDSGYQVFGKRVNLMLTGPKAAISTLKTPYAQAFDFIYEMDLAYALADVVVSRAGALSVSELCLVEKPAILVPFPYASEDHQTKNAMSLVEQNAALLVKDKNANEELVQTALRLLQDADKQHELSKNIKKLTPKEIAETVLQLM